MNMLILLVAGIGISLVHFYLVWRNHHVGRYSISEYAIVDQKSQRIYLWAHLVCDVLFMFFAYRFFWVSQQLKLPFVLLVLSAILDGAQALLPSRGRTEKVHFVVAYVSWFSFLCAGLSALFLITVQQPYSFIAWTSLLVAVGLFAYMHYSRHKLYPYQLAAVPFFVIALAFVVLGSS